MPAPTTVVAQPATTGLRDATAAEPRPSREAAQPYVDLFGSRVCAQAFDDGPAKRPHLARTIHGQLDDLWLRLVELNDAGAGIFATINQVRRDAPRRAENVERVRAFAADCDDPQRREVVEQDISRRGITPSLVIETSPGKRHYYWRTDDCPLDGFKPVQQAIAAALGTDPSICDLPRVLRLPGFVHRKGTPFLVRVVQP